MMSREFETNEPALWLRSIVMDGAPRLVRGGVLAMAEGQDPRPHFETACAEVDQQPESVTRPLAMPIVPAAVFAVDSLETLDEVSEGRAAGFIYTRDAN